MSKRSGHIAKTRLRRAIRPPESVWRLDRLLHVQPRGGRCEINWLVRVLGIAACVATLTGGAAWTAEPTDKPYDQCLDRTSSNPEWAACGEAYRQRLDKRLNVAWKKALASLDGRAARASLLNEQRAWLRYVDVSCKYFADGSFGREGQVVHYPLCRASLVRERISDLNAIHAQAHQDQ